MRTILSSMINVINGLDKVRNEYDDKSKENYKPETRHTFLIINAARTITEFFTT